MNSYCKHLKKLEPLSEGDKPSYLLTLSFARPSSLFKYPLYLYRMSFAQKLKVYFDEVEEVTWKQESSGWSVSIPKRSTISGLEHVEVFIEMKNDFYQFVK